MPSPLAASCAAARMAQGGAATGSFGRWIEKRPAVLEAWAGPAHHPHDLTNDRPTRFRTASIGDPPLQGTAFLTVFRSPAEHLRHRPITPAPAAAAEA